MPFLSCSTNTAQQAALAAAQATQDAAIAALQSGVGVTPAAVASAVDAMTPAQLAAMCAKLNCQPTTAALTAALLGLSGSSVAGNVLTVVAGAPVWQPPAAPAAGPATRVPATGVTDGALPAGVTTTPASVVGFNAAALAAVPDSADTVKGKVALNLGTAAGDAANATDALTAAGFAAMMNGTVPNASPNALQAAAASAAAAANTAATLHGTADAIPLAAGATGTSQQVMDSLVNRNGDYMAGNLNFNTDKAPFWGSQLSRMEMNGTNDVWDANILPGYSGVFHITSNLPPSFLAFGGTKQGFVHRLVHSQGFGDFYSFDMAYDLYGSRPAFRNNNGSLGAWQLL